MINKTAVLALISFVVMSVAYFVPVASAQEGKGGKAAKTDDKAITTETFRPLAQ